jgi:hypothetical protein
LPTSPVAQKLPIAQLLQNLGVTIRLNDFVAPVFKIKFQLALLKVKLPASTVDVTDEVMMGAQLVGRDRFRGIGQYATASELLQVLREFGDLAVNLSQGSHSFG